MTDRPTPSRRSRRPGRFAAAAGAWSIALLGAMAGGELAQAQPSRPVSVVRAVAVPDTETPSWSATLERIAGSVVAIKVDQTRAFDTEWNTSSQATGFVVDAERGLILTNRHVVTPGPVTAEATFLNREEVPLYPVYRDPVHDFGLYRYDPSKLRFIRPQALPLHPEGAQIGREIRVIGNNAGEQLSILQGTLAKLDRLAPAYGVGKYNDFNTFYLQAASGTSGGSSGSPVVDIHGRVVALNAGGATSNASSFYLPLARVKRALQLIQQGKPVTRGTLQTVFTYAPYDELRRLGLDTETEVEVRRIFPAYTGMLVVAEVQPGSPADGALQPGDILRKVNGLYVTQFEPLAAVLDEGVGQTVKLELSRGGKAISTSLPIGDLHAITPAAYLDFGESIVHTLSYQQARHFNVPVRGAYVANPGYLLGASGIPRGAVIRSIDGKDIAGLDDFEQAIATLGHGDRAAMRYTTIDDPNGSQLRSVRMDRRWFPARRCTRDDAQGTWQCVELAAGPPSKPATAGSTTFARPSDRRAARLAPSLVGVGFDMPYSVSGITERNYYGTGLVVDAARGLVVVDRNTVPVSIGDVRLTFAGTLEVPGRVEYVHPLHNLAVVSFDPRLIGDTPIRAATFDRRDLVPGEPVWVIGLGRDGDIKVRGTQIGDIEPLVLPLSRTMRFRDTNLDVATLTTTPGVEDGVVVDKNGRVRGLWSSFAYESGRETQQMSRAIGIDLAADMVERLRDHRPLYSLETELAAQSLASARRLGLTPAWLRQLEAAGGDKRQVLTITRLVGGAPAQSLLHQGDLLLAIDGRIVTRFRDLERAVADRSQVRVTVWREQAEVEIDVPTVPLTGIDVARVVQWGGATLQAPHRAMLAQRGMPPVGVYVSYFAYGSPATRYGLFPGRRIVEVDGIPTPDLDSFLDVVTGREDRTSVRLRTITWNNAPEVITLKLDKHYWPAYETRRNGDGWERRALE
ncbi:MAG: trypsin-like peptidase domain-containing protein [Sinobacteraceae bacterium]|nr:trypsin-like peptidase domain-containing protein [Nevskiaceae bacterium]MCP5339433.1 trypsin-like peptidase domain-containing protein [Nevskiaceae bacterium]MCP5360546.1 trypsin-like peptidase domain-containing protein [Nevskiaceae bacterium]